MTERVDSRLLQFRLPEVPRTSEDVRSRVRQNRMGEGLEIDVLVVPCRGTKTLTITNGRKNRTSRTSYQDVLVVRDTDGLE